MTMECLEYIGLRIFHFSRGLTRKTAKEVTSSQKRVCDTLLAVLEERRNPCDLDSIACLALSLTNRDLFRD